MTRLISDADWVVAVFKNKTPPNGIYQILFEIYFKRGGAFELHVFLPLGYMMRNGFDSFLLFHKKVT